MLPLRPVIRRYGIHQPCHDFPSVTRRHASLTSSIERGVRKAANALRAAEQKRVREGNLGFWEKGDREKVAQAERNAYGRRRRELEYEERLKFLRSNASHPHDPYENEDAARRQERDLRTRKRLIANDFLVDAPAAVPYTQHNSELLYGTFAVLAALRSKRRKMHKLYLWCGEDGNLVDNDRQTTEILRLARQNKVPILRVAGSWEKMLDRMSERRPHNGLVLDASPLPQLPTKVLHSLAAHGDNLTISLNQMDEVQKADFQLAADAKTYTIPRTKNSARFPFILWLDRVTDTGNMGAILRTAYFFGVDAIIIPQHGTAPLNAVAVKTSAGAAEHVPVLKIENENKFIKDSQANGWKFFAAAAQDSESTLKNKSATSESAGASIEALRSSPCVLMLGNEGSGLRAFLQQQADGAVSIASPAAAGNSVDSLNVSVAAALLTARFLAIS